MSKFDQMRPIVNAKINEDDTITTLSGEPIDMETAGPIFKTYKPLKNQMINPDDSLSPLNFGGGGGGSGTLTNITSKDGTIEVTGNSAVKNIEIKINANDKILSTSNNGISSNLSINYNSSTGELSLLGKNNQEIGKVNLEISSFLENAEIIANPSGQPEGTYLVLTFKKASGDGNKIYINVNTLADIYTSGNRAIEISSDNKISLKIDINSKLGIDEEGLCFVNGYGALSDENKEKYNNYEITKQNKLIAGDLIEINEATNTIKVINVYNKTEIDDLLNLKQGELTAGDLIEINKENNTIKVINVYNKTEIDNLLNNKQGELTAGDLIEINKENNIIKVINVYNKTEINDLLNLKQNKLIAGNLIEINEATNTIGVKDVYNKEEIDSIVASSFHYKGSVATENDLPTENNKIGDVWNILNTGSNFAWDGTTWDNLAGVVDLSNYYSKTETNNLLNTKQNNLIFDNIPIKNSANPVTSGGIYEAIKNVFNPDPYVNENVSGTITLDLALHNLFILTLTGNTIINFSNPQAGMQKKIIIKQDSAGGKTVTWNSIVKWPDGGSSKPIESSPNKKTLVSLILENSTNALVETFNYNY